jgi:hypothetical protein
VGANPGWGAAPGFGLAEEIAREQMNSMLQSG